MPTLMTRRPTPAGNTAANADTVPGSVACHRLGTPASGQARRPNLGQVNTQAYGEQKMRSETPHSPIVADAD